MDMTRHRAPRDRRRAPAHAKTRRASGRTSALAAALSSTRRTLLAVAAAASVAVTGIVALPAVGHASTTIEPVSYWQSKFDAQESSFYSTATSKTTSSDSWDYYNGAYYLDGYVSMFEATGQTKYLDKALTLTNNMISKARLSSSMSSSQYKDGYYGWVSFLNGQTGHEIPLYESYMWRYVTEMLRAMHDNAAVMGNSTYKSKYDSILAFTERNIFDKWYSRGANTNIYRQNTHMASHWAFIAIDLAQLTTDSTRYARYMTVFNNINLHLPNYSGSLRGQLVASGSGWFWNANWGSFAHPGQDVSHGNGVLAYITEAAWMGKEWTATDMARFVATLNNTVWPVAGSGSQYVDGSGSGNGWFNDGWVKLGAFSAALQVRLEGHSGGGQYMAAMALNAARLSGAAPSPSPSPSPSPTTSTSTTSTSTSTSTSSSSYPSAVGADGPVAYWRLGETSGTTAADVEGAHPGSYLNGVALGRGSLIANDANPSVQTDGVNDYVKVPDSAALHFGTAFSLEAWINPVALPASGSFASVATKAESYSLQFNGPRIEFTVIQSGVRHRATAPAGSIAVGSRYHIVGTYDGQNQRLYINGKLVVQVALTGAATSTTSPVTIGSWNGSREFFSGRIDEVAVYAKTLSATAVASHYAAGA